MNNPSWQPLSQEWEFLMTLLSPEEATSVQRFKFREDQKRAMLSRCRDPWPATLQPRFSKDANSRVRYIFVQLAQAPAASMRPQIVRSGMECDLLGTYEGQETLLCLWRHCPRSSELQFQCVARGVCPKVPCILRKGVRRLVIKHIGLLIVLYTHITTERREVDDCGV